MNGYQMLSTYIRSSTCNHWSTYMMNYMKWPWLQKCVYLLGIVAVGHEKHIHQLCGSLGPMPQLLLSIARTSLAKGCGFCWSIPLCGTKVSCNFGHLQVAGPFRGSENTFSAMACYCASDIQWKLRSGPWLRLVGKLIPVEEAHVPTCG